MDKECLFMLLALIADSLVPSNYCSLLPISSAKWTSLNENSGTILICRVEIGKSLKTDVNSSGK